MSRELQNVINNDHEIIRLRMDVEDLINAAESYSDKIFQEEACRLESAINKRIEIIIFEETERTILK